MGPKKDGRKPRKQRKDNRIKQYHESERQEFEPRSCDCLILGKKLVPHIVKGRYEWETHQEFKNTERNDTPLMEPITHGLGHEGGYLGSRESTNPGRDARKIQHFEKPLPLRDELGHQLKAKQHSRRKPSSPLEESAIQDQQMNESSNARDKQHESGPPERPTRKGGSNWVIETASPCSFSDKESDDQYIVHASQSETAGSAQGRKHQSTTSGQHPGHVRPNMAGQKSRQTRPNATREGPGGDPAGSSDSSDDSETSNSSNSPAPTSQPRDRDSTGEDSPIESESESDNPAVESGSSRTRSSSTKSSYRTPTVEEQNEEGSGNMDPDADEEEPELPEIATIEDAENTRLPTSQSPLFDEEYNEFVEDDDLLDELEVLEEIAGAVEDGYENLEPFETDPTVFDYRQKKGKPTTREMGTVSLGDISTRFVYSPYYRCFLLHC